MAPATSTHYNMHSPGVLAFAEIALSDAVDRGITVTEIAPMDRPIDIAPETTAAFVGRARRGPLNTPILLRHFGDFRRHFGDVWDEASLGPVVKAFFEHGGRKLYVVRVANDARGAVIRLPAGSSALTLRAVQPGENETVRAAVDYDGIDVRGQDRFNLTLQRVDPANSLIIDQEIFRKLSCDAAATSFVADALLSSTMVRVEQPFPATRPDVTVSGDNRFQPMWVEASEPGTDGAELTDYDLIGSREAGTGLFALAQCEQFDILYLPPPARNRDAGPAAVLAAERYCRRRGAMLIIDPATSWKTVADATRGIDQLGYASPHILAYFPPAREDADPLGGAIAGLLCKLDRRFGPWHAPDDESLHFSRATKLLIDVGDRQHLLSRAGMNALVSGPNGRARLLGSVTLGRGNEAQRVFKSLPVQRLCLRILNSVDLATRWAVFEQPNRKLRARIRTQILDYLHALARVGALRDDRIVVHCDAGVAGQDDEAAAQGVTLLLVFQPVASKTPISFTLHQSAAGCRIASTAFAPVAADCV